jgi:hypothetical protein
MPAAPMVLKCNATPGGPFVFTLTVDLEGKWMRFGQNTGVQNHFHDRPLHHGLVRHAPRLRVGRAASCRQGLIDTTTGHDEHESDDALQMTDHGRRWIDANDDQFLLRKGKAEQSDFEAQPERW